MSDEDLVSTASKMHVDLVRWDKQPVWARDEVRRLLREVAHLRARLSEGPESNTWEKSHSSIPRPLGWNPTIGHTFTDSASGREFRTDVKFRDGMVEVLTMGGHLVVRPFTGNVVRIGTVERFTW